MFKKTAKILMIFIILILGVSVVIYICMPTADANKPMILDYLGIIASGLFSVLCVMITFHYQEVRDNQQALIDQENQMNMIRIENLPDIAVFLDYEIQNLDPIQLHYEKGQIRKSYHIPLNIRCTKNSPNEITFHLYRADQVMHGPYAFENYKHISFKQFIIKDENQEATIDFSDDDTADIRYYLLQMDYMDKFNHQYSEHIYVEYYKYEEKRIQFRISNRTKYLIKNGRAYSYIERNPHSNQVWDEVNRKYDELIRTKLDENILNKISTVFWSDLECNFDSKDYGGGGGPHSIEDNGDEVKIYHYSGMAKGKNEINIIYEISFKNNQYSYQNFVMKNKIYKLIFKNIYLQYKIEKKRYCIEKDTYGIIIKSKELNLFQYILLCFERIKIKRKLRKIDSERGE